jgi:hypothetical protein
MKNLIELAEHRKYGAIIPLMGTDCFAILEEEDGDVYFVTRLGTRFFLSLLLPDDCMGTPFSYTPSPATGSSRAFRRVDAKITFTETSK